MDGRDGSGSAYVLTSTNGTAWTQSAKLSASDAAEEDTFGVVSLSSDGRTALIGAPGDSDGGRYSGSAYVFTSANGTSWTQSAKLTATDRH